MPKEQSLSKPTTRRYSEEEKAGAVRMVRTLRAERDSEHRTVKRVAEQLGYGVESVRLWVRQADIDDGHVPGVSTDGAARLRELEQEVRKLRRANEILKRAAHFFGAELDRQSRRNWRSSTQPRRGRGSSARGRAHLPSAAGGPEHVLRRQDPPTFRAGLPRCAAGLAVGSVMVDGHFRSSQSRHAPTTHEEPGWMAPEIPWGRSPWHGPPATCGIESACTSEWLTASKWVALLVVTRQCRSGRSCRVVDSGRRAGITPE